ncbi:MAG: Fur family transcriptional regulator [Candidatus Ratteibacteria bacterium]
MENNYTKIKIELKNKGLKLTPQKVLILKKLREMKNHPSINDLIAEIKNEYPYICSSTVYKLFRIFENKNIIQQIPSFGDERRFDGNIKPHPHFICLKCGSIEDIKRCNVKIFLKKGYKIIPENTIFCGICKKCYERR